MGLYAERKVELRYWWNMVTRNKNKLVERKASVDTGEIKGADLRDKFLF